MYPAAVLILPNSSSAIKICARLQLRFYCCGAKLCNLSEAQARSLASPSSAYELASHSVLATAWAVDAPGLLDALELFVSSIPSGLRATFGPQAVVGPGDAAICFAPSELLLELAEPEVPPAPAPAPAIAASQRQSATRASPAPTKGLPNTAEGKIAPPAAAATPLVELSIARSKAGGGQLVDLRIARARCDAPCARGPAAAKPQKAPSPPDGQRASVASKPEAAAGRCAAQQRAPLVDLAIRKAPAGGPRSVVLSIAKCSATPPPSKPSAAKSKASRAPAVGAPPPREAAPEGAGGGCVAPPRAAAANPVPSFKSAAHIAAMQPCLAASAEQQHAFHFGRPPWHATAV